MKIIVLFKTHLDIGFTDFSANVVKKYNEIYIPQAIRVAEAITLSDISSGASNDIERATEISRKMVTRYGMSSELGPVMYGSSNNEVFLGRDFSSSRNYSEAIAAEIDTEIKSIVTDAYNRCEKILRDNMDQLITVAEYLIKHEKADGDVFKLLMTGEYIEPAEEVPALEKAETAETDNSTEE